MFLFLPGILSIGIIYFLTTSKPMKIYFYIVVAFILGSLSYTFLAPLFSFFKKDVTFFKCLFDSELLINTKEILWGSLIGIVLGIIITYIVNYEIFHRIARKIKLTSKFAEVNVWAHLLNSPDIQNSWVLIRDQNKDLMYEGWIEYYSTELANNEVFLRDVKVYINSTGDELYSLDGLYLMKNQNDITLEIREIDNIN
jgi:hypothetical protein